VVAKRQDCQPIDLHPFVETREGFVLFGIPDDWFAALVDLPGNSFAAAENRNVTQSVTCRCRRRQRAEDIVIAIVFVDNCDGKLQPLTRGLDGSVTDIRPRARLRHLASCSIHAEKGLLALSALSDFGTSGDDTLPAQD